MLSLNEIKTYLRVDHEEENELLMLLHSSAVNRCMDIARLDSVDKLKENPNAKIAVLYTIAYLYENREEACHNELNLTLRALLFGLREEGF